MNKKIIKIIMFIHQTEIPTCEIPLICNLYDENNNLSSPTKTLKEFVEGDCWAVKVKYLNVCNSII